MAPPAPKAHHSRAERETEGEAERDGGHARKLYVLYASDATTYLEMTGEAAEPATAPVGLALVKESYQPELVPEADGPAPHAYTPEMIELVARGGFYPYATHEGKRHRTGARRDLFVMLKRAPGTPGADALGWVHGTVTPEGVVTAAGAIESCIRCHRRAEHDGLFGLE